MIKDPKLFTARVNGDLPSWYNQEDNLDGYTTNYGGVTIVHGTELIKFACYGLGREYKNTSMTVRIKNSEEFQVEKTKTSKAAELNSPGYPYPHKHVPTLSILEILEMLQKDENYYYAGMLIKKTLVRLMLKHFKFNKEEKRALKELFQIWRKPIVGKIKRTPIVTGGNQNDLS